MPSFLLGDTQDRRRDQGAGKAGDLYTRVKVGHHQQGGRTAKPLEDKFHGIENTTQPHWRPVFTVKQRFKTQSKPTSRPAPANAAA